MDFGRGREEETIYLWQPCSDYVASLFLFRSSVLLGSSYELVTPKESRETLNISCVSRHTNTRPRLCFPLKARSEL